MTTGMRLALGASVILCATGYWAFIGASSSWQYYLTVDEYLAEPANWHTRPIRVSGHVAIGSLAIDSELDVASFRLAGSRGGLPIVHRGVLPDNLAEGRSVVVVGVVDDDGILRAKRILTRCASKYSSSSSVAAGEMSGDR